MLYRGLCGSPPEPVRSWHWQWLLTVDLHRDLRAALAATCGRVLDVGCGEQPYRSWLAPAAEYVGIDVERRPGVDQVIAPGTDWPFEAGDFDAVLCTQVLEHDTRPEHTVAQIRRVLRPGGRLVLTLPFAYNEHAMPHDYRRWSANGAALLLADGFEVEAVRRQGRAGSLLAGLWLNWLEHVINRSVMRQVARGVLLPLWIGYCGAVNVAGRTIDALDGTSAFYTNVMVLATRSSD